jgi:hypothetical protein
MGIISQIIGVKVRGQESLHEKVTQISKTVQALNVHMAQEKQLEHELSLAHNRRNSTEIKYYQKKIIENAAYALKDTEHLFVELFAVTNDERDELKRVILEIQRIIHDGLNTKEEQETLNALQAMEHKVYSVLTGARATAGFER